MTRVTDGTEIVMTERTPQEFELMRESGDNPGQAMTDGIAYVDANDEENAEETWVDEEGVEHRSHTPQTALEYGTLDGHLLVTAPVKTDLGRKVVVKMDEVTGELEETWPNPVAIKNLPADCGESFIGDLGTYVIHCPSYFDAGSLEISGGVLAFQFSGREGASARQFTDALSLPNMPQKLYINHYGTASAEPGNKPHIMIGTDAAGWSRIDFWPLPAELAEEEVTLSLPGTFPYGAFYLLVGCGGFWPASGDLAWHIDGFRITT